MELCGDSDLDASFKSTLKDQDMQKDNKVWL